VAPTSDPGLRRVCVGCLGRCARHGSLHSGEQLPQRSERAGAPVAPSRLAHHPEHGYYLTQNFAAH